MRTKASSDSPGAATPAGDAVYRDNLRLSELEYFEQRIYLRSQPRCLGLVLGNACNIYCPHCYQSKNGDNLLKPAAIGWELRREFAALYPYLSTLRIQGGEAFAFAGFRDLVEDLAATVRRPVLSASTNGTLIGNEWAETIVRLPFRNLTVSIDAGTPATYARLRQGAELDAVLANVRRIQRWKQKLGAEMPYLDSFFVVMRSNFREIPQYLELMSQYGFSDVTLQTVLINGQNSAREPGLARDEAFTDFATVRELHALLRGVLPGQRARFRGIRTSGLTTLFEQHGLDASFLQEASQGLYPDSDDLARPPRRGPEVELAPAGPHAEGFGLCPNPWTTLFIAENGDAHLCFLADKIGNLYETPLAALWNCERALIKRSQMVSGRYLKSGCSPYWCSWREGRKTETPSAEIRALSGEMKQLADRAAGKRSPVETTVLAGSGATGAGAPEGRPSIAAVRRLLASRERRLRELEAMFVQLCQTNEELHEKGRQHIEHLEAKVARLEAEFKRLRRQPLVRLSDKIWRAWARPRRGAGGGR